MTDQPAPTEGGRPLGVLIVALVQFVRAALRSARCWGSAPPERRLAEDRRPVAGPATGTVAFVIARAIGIGLVAASVLVGIGLLAGRRWGWIGSIVISGLSLAFALGAWWDGHPVYAAMVINIVAVFYLNQREVRAVYDVVPAEAEAEAEEPA
jgi:hypothetical protein